MFKVGDLFLLGFRLATIEERYDETAQKINANDYIQQIFTLRLIKSQRIDLIQALIGV